MNTDAVLEIQNALRRLHFTDSRLPPVFPTGIYDAQTESAVTIYQRLRGLSETGMVDSDTFDRLIAESESARTSAAFSLPVFHHSGFLLQAGNADEAVWFVQQILALLAKRYQNLSDVPLTGVYDQATAEAVRAVQRLRNLEESGNLDVQSWNALVQLFANRNEFGSESR